jgi:cation diffusion facilitator family transporter
MNNFTDIASCAVVIIAFGLALNGAEKAHPYGYGRIEYIAGFVTSIIVTLVGMSFAYSALSRMAMPTPVWFKWTYFWIVALTIAVKILMGLMYSKVNKKLNSPAIKALIIDSFLDTGVTTMALISFLLMQYSGARLDAIFGLIISAFIIAGGIKLIRSTGGELIGSGADEETEKAIKAIAERHSGIKAGKLILHNYGFSGSLGTLEITHEEGILSAMKAGEVIINEINNKLNIGIQIIPKEQL